MEALSRALERKRSYYNALFAEARQRSTDLEPGDLLEHLRLRVAPIVQALPGLGADSEDRVLDVLYRASLELLSRRLAGRRAMGSINAVWEQLLPRTAPLLAIAPRRVVAALSNAAFNLDQAPSARPAQFLRTLLAVVDHCADLETLFAAGQIAAWRSGLPQYRAHALASCARLPEAALQALLSPQGEQTVSLTELQQNRFSYSSASDQRLTTVGKLGGFTGYGGPFKTPPTLTQIDGVLVAFDEETAWEIHADAFGALLRRRKTLPPRASAPPPLQHFELSRLGKVRLGALEAQFVELAEAHSAAADSQLLAIVPARSHYVYLVAAARGWPC